MTKRNEGICGVNHHRGASNPCDLCGKTKRAKLSNHHKECGSPEHDCSVTPPQRSDYVSAKAFQKAVAEAKPSERVSASTPGPWEVGLMSTDVRTFSYRDESCSVICNLSSDIVDPDEAEANARLIAAAPELFTMLQRVLDEVCMTEEGMKHVAPLTLEQARSAIEKASGEVL